MKSKNEKINTITCENSYYIPDTNIRVDEHDPNELDKLWNKLNTIHSLL